MGNKTSLPDKLPDTATREQVQRWRNLTLKIADFKIEKQALMEEMDVSWCTDSSDDRRNCYDPDSINPPIIVNHGGIADKYTKKADLENRLSILRKLISEETAKAQALLKSIKVGKKQGGGKHKQTKRKKKRRRKSRRKRTKRKRQNRTKRRYK